MVAIHSKKSTVLTNIGWDTNNIPSDNLQTASSVSNDHSPILFSPILQSMQIRH